MWASVRGEFITDVEIIVVISTEDTFPRQIVSPSHEVPLIDEAGRSEAHDFDTPFMLIWMPSCKCSGFCMGIQNELELFKKNIRAQYIIEWSLQPDTASGASKNVRW